MTPKEKAKSEIQKLVNRFDEHYSQYKDSKYTEAPTRRDFIDPFFKALGWDIDNQGSMAEAYREVIHEDKVKISGQLKSPDYSFRFNGKRYFFVEAKKPSVNIKDDSNPAYQVKRYAWSAKLKRLCSDLMRLNATILINGRVDCRNTGKVMIRDFLVYDFS